jgi:hypothetical protein
VTGAVFPPRPAGRENGKRNGNAIVSVIEGETGTMIGDLEVAAMTIPTMTASEGFVRRIVRDCTVAARSVEVRMMSCLMGTRDLQEPDAAVRTKTITRDANHATPR